MADIIIPIALAIQEWQMGHVRTKGLSQAAYIVQRVLDDEAIADAKLIGHWADAVEAAEEPVCRCAAGMHTCGAPNLGVEGDEQ